MLNDLINVDRLRNLIGHEVDYEGQRCQIIEILEDGPALILQHRAHLTRIQPDQHGEAHRKVPSTITVPVLNQEGVEINPVFDALQLRHLLK